MPKFSRAERSAYNAGLLKTAMDAEKSGKPLSEAQRKIAQSYQNGRAGVKVVKSEKKTNRKYFS